MPPLQLLHNAFCLVALSAFDSSSISYWWLILGVLIHESEWQVWLVLTLIAACPEKQLVGLFGTVLRTLTS